MFFTIMSYTGYHGLLHEYLIKLTQNIHMEITSQPCCVGIMQAKAGQEARSDSNKEQTNKG
jgi:hypothetical protein